MILLTKKNHWCNGAIQFARMLNPDIEVHSGTADTPFPLEPGRKTKVLISFLSPWIIPKHILDNVQDAQGTAINFHPAPPEYPGSGCYNFALYHGVTEYGATCHHMEAIPDTGKIIDTIRFPIYNCDTVFSLQHRTLDHMLILFYRIFPIITKNICLSETLEGSKSSETSETWARKPYLKKELDKLCRITPEMSKEEIERRIRATQYPGRNDPCLVFQEREYILKEPDK
ncbi:formyltransferase family protein [Desulfamplus magnetovallimortis]|nr:formyltransferase family protein [Desulfamplus magnetovallimortis]